MSSRDLPTDLVARAAVGPRVLLVSIEGMLVVHDLPEHGTLVIGRGAEADIVLDHRSVSRRHATLEIDGDQNLLVDLDSANGTFVGGRRLAQGQPAPFGVGTLVEIGTVLVTLRGGPAAEVARGAGEMVIADPAMTALHETARVAAASTLSVLLLGETGVGKELFARQIHELSPRAALPLVRVDCASLGESLLEAELFGHERGAFPGATQAKEGLLEAAAGGTVFLDEIGEMPLPTQAKLLRVVDSGEVTRVGALKPRRVDVRFVAATHRDLRGLTESGRFREDLFFRLDGISLRIPPLRERTAEIVPLANSFLTAAAQGSGTALISLSAEAVALLRANTWTGNVRELRNVIMRSVLFCKTGVLEASDLRFDSREAASVTTSAPPPADPAVPTVPPPPPGLSPERADRRTRAIEALEKTVWNQTRAAELLGVSRRTLQTWMIDLGIPRPRGSR